MFIFHSYVSLPEGILGVIHWFIDWFDSFIVSFIDPLVFHAFISSIINYFVHWFIRLIHLFIGSLADSLIGWFIHSVVLALILSDSLMSLLSCHFIGVSTTIGPFIDACTSRPHFFIASALHWHFICHSCLIAMFFLLKLPPGHGCTAWSYCDRLVDSNYYHLLTVCPINGCWLESWICV